MHIRKSAAIVGWFLACNTTAWASTAQDHAIGFRPGDWSITKWRVTGELDGIPTNAAPKTYRVCIPNLKAGTVPSLQIHGPDGSGSGSGSTIHHQHSTTVVLHARLPQSVETITQTYRYAGPHDYTMTGKAVGHYLPPHTGYYIGYEHGHWLSSACIQKHYHPNPVSEMAPGKWSIETSMYADHGTVDMHSTHDVCIHHEAVANQILVPDLHHCKKTHAQFQDGKYSVNMACILPNSKLFLHYTEKVNASKTAVHVDESGYVEMAAGKFPSKTTITARRIGDCS